MTTKLNHIKSALRESIEIAGKATEGPWVINQLTQMFIDGKTASPSIAIQRPYVEGVCSFAEPFRGWCTYADATFLAHARTMTPLACKALLLAIEGLERIANHPTIMDESISLHTLTSITYTWPDA